jgi:hypothetical protein
LEWFEFGSQRHLTLSDGYMLEVFPDDSVGGEYWRLFQPYRNTEHLVVTGQGIEVG